MIHHKRKTKIPKGQTEIVMSEEQNEMKDKQRTHNTILKTKAGETCALQH